MQKLLLIIGLTILAISVRAQVVTESNGFITANTENYTIAIEKDGFRYEFRRPDGKVIAPAHQQSGIQIGSDPENLKDVIETRYIGYQNQILNFKVYTIEGVAADVKIDVQPNWARFSIEPESKEKYAIIGRTGGITPAYGLADHSIIDVNSSDVTGFKSENFTSRGGDIRLISNFVIFPERGFANVNIEPLPKIVRVTEEENVQGVLEGTAMPSLYYFIGSGFWPGARRSGTEGTTVSFGMWDDTATSRNDGLPNPRYPDPEALQNNYLLRNREGMLVRSTNNSFPGGPIFFLDSFNEEAMEWSKENVDLWSVDGFKEDAMIYDKHYQDAMWNPFNKSDNLIEIIKSSRIARELP